MRFKSKIGMALVLTGVMIATTGCFDSHAEGGQGGQGGTVNVYTNGDSGSSTSSDSGESDKVSQILNEAQSAIDDQNYEGAITTLETALKKSPTNKDLIAKYVNAVKLRVNELTSKNDYDKALAILKVPKSNLRTTMRLTSSMMKQRRTVRISSAT